MERLLIKITDGLPSESTNEIYDNSGVVFYLSRSAWTALKKLEPYTGFFAALNKSKEMKCVKCGSFTVPCRDLFYAINPETQSVLGFDWPQGRLSELSYDLLCDDIWQLLNIVTEEKITTNEEWEAFQHNTLPEKKLLYTCSGELIFPEEGYPLGLVFEEVFFKVTEVCESCDHHIC